MCTSERFQRHSSKLAKQPGIQTSSTNIIKSKTSTFLCVQRLIFILFPKLFICLNLTDTKVCQHVGRSGKTSRTIDDKTCRGY